METGGMKGRRKELIREELHEILCEGFVSFQHSFQLRNDRIVIRSLFSWGTEFLNVLMNILIRDTEDALTYAENHKNWWHKCYWFYKY
jgi:hypothetical protein